MTKLSTDKQFADFINSIPFTDPLTPKEAFSGGRTEIFTLYKNADEDEDIQYSDIVSLYPYLMSVKPLPVYHPDILFGANVPQTIENIFGLVKLKILPPDDLFIPVLGIHTTNGKLVFPLCQKCAEMIYTNKCPHTDDQRALVGVWATPELEEALKNNYTIVQIYEIWNWPTEKQSSHLFDDFMRHFMKYKIEASGFPVDCDTIIEKEKYVELWKEKFNIDLDIDQIRHDPGLRSVTKRACTSHRENTLFVDQPGVYFDLLLSDHETVTGVQIVNEEVLEVQYKTDPEFRQVHPFTNVALAAFITAYGRLELYKYIKTLGERCLYVDTDSLIFVGQGPVLGRGLLGDLADEIYSTHKVRDTIQLFCGTGPKSYAYQLKDNSDIKMCKIKGITLNHDTSQKINLQTMCDLLSDMSTSSIEVVTKNSMRREKETKRIKACAATKTFRITNDKRVKVVGTYETLPYGHKDIP
jgi:hypothetical protein